LLLGRTAESPEGEAMEQALEGREGEVPGTSSFSSGDEPESLTRLRVLDEICHAFASATDAEEAYRGTIRWVREAVGDEEATVRIVLPDKRGRLQVVSAEGASRAGLRNAHSAREDVSRSKRPALLPSSSDRTVLRMPLISRGDAVGVLEVVASGGAIDRGTLTLRAVASQAAITLRNLRQRAELGREIAVRSNLAAVAQELLRAGSREAALEAAARFCFSHLEVPAAGWLYAGDERGMRLVTAHGVRDRNAATMHTRMGWIPHWKPLPSRERESLAGAFAGLADADDFSEVAVGDALFIAGGMRSGLLAVVEDLLEEILEHHVSVTRAQRRNEQLDLALAWTAHEFRGPLLGVKAIVEQLLDAGEDPAKNPQTLENLHSELQELVALVEPVLQWAAGAVPLQPRETDLVELAREAAASSENREQPIDILGPDRLMAPVDSNHLRMAISNLIRNARAYSPAGGTVEMTVGADDDGATISIADRGPGIPPSERDTIFDPFMRGKLGQSTRFGKGLGLFIARRVVEAHGGRIWVESPNGEGAVFHMAIPTR
jgi:signal transduction histidine kinase